MHVYEYMHNGKLGESVLIHLKKGAGKDGDTEENSASSCVFLF